MCLSRTSGTGSVIKLGPGGLSFARLTGPVTVTVEGGPLSGILGSFDGPQPGFVIGRNATLNNPSVLNYSSLVNYGVVNLTQLNGGFVNKVTAV